MQARGLRHLLLGAVLCVGVVGCSHQGKHKEGKGEGYGAASTQGAGAHGGFSGDEQDLMSKRKIYFDFDRSDIHEQDYEVIYAHADYLKGDSSRHVRIEGHADEQGSREYNVALGERRARAVANALVSQGVAPHQIATVSFGKEKPDVMGHSEEAYRLNRRAVIVYE